MKRNIKRLVLLPLLLLYVCTIDAQIQSVEIDNVVYQLLEKYDWDKDEYVKYVTAHWNWDYDINYNGYPAVELNIKSKVSFPGSEIEYPVIYIDEKGFEGCNIKSITIPNSVTVIKRQAFKDCRFLSHEITIPGSVTSIEPSAFKNCKMLWDINCEATTPPKVRYYSSIPSPIEEWTSAFDGFNFTTVEGKIGSGVYLHVPIGCRDAYENPSDRNALDWSLFERIFDDLPTDVKTIVVDDKEGSTVYYNISGLRIDNPVQGELYIKIQGTNASKVIYKQ